MDSLPSSNLMKPENPLPVIVTRREVERIFIQKKAESAIHEIARTENQDEYGLALAMTGAILKELQQAEQQQGTDRVLITAQHGPASRLQSLIASGAAGELSLTPMPSGGLEAKFDTGDWGGWAGVAWAKLRHAQPHPMLRPKTAVPQSLPETCRIGVLGDWGTNLYGAPKIAQAILNDPSTFDLLLHLGDVYYAGDKKEMRTRFLDVWPKRKEAINRALNSNHDMYSGGEYYFTDALPAFNQETSYFAMQNSNWTLVGLDVAYMHHSIDDEQVAWLASILRQAGGRKVVLFSHHQLFSSFESQGVKLWANKGFAEILKSRRIFAWYWGHEHRCVIFQEQDVPSGIWGRCIGHGGMPQSRARTLYLPKAIQPGGDWRQVPALNNSQSGLQLAPPAIVLEGPNNDIPEEQEKFLPHGYAVLTLDGKHLLEEVRDSGGKIVYSNRLA